MTNNENCSFNETIYKIENEVIEAVIMGQTQNALHLLSDIPSAAYSELTVLYCFEFNALMRKAAERGGVHADYLIENSDMIINNIKEMSSKESFDKMLKEIAASYSELVNEQAHSKYSSPVKRAIIKIHHDLTDDITLKNLARFNNMSAGYFSSLFRSETGKTLTDYVNQKRIEKAKTLLKTTHLQIKEIGALCGVDDMNYFTKLFKKYEGITPKDYRMK